MHGIYMEAHLKPIQKTKSFLRLLKKVVALEWDEQCQNALKDIKSYTNSQF